MSTMASLTMNHSDISRTATNSVTGEGYGAGIYMANGDLKMSQSTISSAHARSSSNMAWGGALFVYAGTASITGSNLTNVSVYALRESRSCPPSYSSPC